MRMRLGCFGFIKDIDDISAAGYDCVELHVREIMSLGEAEYKAARARLRASGITAEAFDNPIPLDSKVCDQSFDLGFYRDFLSKAANRCAEMGARYFVFGNGKARSLPEEGDLRAAKAKFDEFFAMLLDIAAERNITVLIEPLNRERSNIVNGLPEAIAFIERYGRPNLKTLIDYRYMYELGWPLSDIVKYEPFIAHAHLDNPLTVFPERVFPRLDDGFDYGPFLDTLKRISFKGILAVEASAFKDFKSEISRGLRFFEAHGLRPYRAD